MPHRFRSAFAILLCLLLVGAQHEALRHALSHVASHAATQPLALPATADVPCIECALIAGGTAAVGGRIHASAAPVPASGHPLPPPAAWSQPAPAYYRSRAPPSLS